MQPTTANKRQKITRACDLCRKQKKKCSGTQPCDGCTRLQRHCTFNAIYTHDRVVAPPASADGSGTTGSMHLVDPVSASVHSATHDGAASEALLKPTLDDTTSHSITSFSPVATQHSQQQLGFTFNDHVAGIGQNLDSNIESRPGSVEPTSHDPAGNAVNSISTYTWVQRAYMRLNAAKKMSMHISNGDTTTSVRITEFGDANCGPDQPLVSLEELSSIGSHWLQKLTDIYFERACATYRYLHRPTINGWIECISRQEFTQFTPSQLAILFSLFAHGHKYLFQAEERESGFAMVASISSDRLSATARSYMDEERGPPTNESVQARLIRVHFLMSCGRPNQAWYTFGLVVQLTLAMSLHQGRPDREYKSKLSREMSRRVFWSVYATDKYLSIVLGRPTLLQDNAISEKLPSPASDEDVAASSATQRLPFEERDSEVEATVLQAKLCQIINRVISEQNNRDISALLSIIAATNARLEQWRSDIPPHLSRAVRPSSLIPVFRRQATVLNLFYLHAVILTNRPLLLQSLSAGGSRRRQPDLVEAEQLQQGVNACVSSALEVVEQSTKFSPEGQRFAVFWFTQNVTFSAVCILYLSILRARDACRSHELSPDEKYLLSRAQEAQRCLAEASEGNPPSLRYTVVLEELRDEIEGQSKTAVGADHPIQGVEGADGTNHRIPGDDTIDPTWSSMMAGSSPFADHNVEFPSMFWSQLDAVLLGE